MAKSKNTKVNRLLGALAVELREQSDATILNIHNIINDERDGYDFDFVTAVNAYRQFVEPRVPSFVLQRHDHADEKIIAMANDGKNFTFYTNVQGDAETAMTLMGYGCTEYALCTPGYIKETLEYLRVQLRSESISYGELVYLQSLAEYIDPSDVELLEAAGVPEFPDEGDSDA